jgi:2-keto-4-pentenoate hydratase
LSTRLGGVPCFTSDQVEMFEIVSLLRQCRWLVASRYQDPAKVGVFEAVADNVAHDGMVFGADVPGWRDMDLANLTVRQTHAGAVQVEKVGGNPAGDPVISLLWLANFLPSIGLALEPGQMVISGSCTGLTWVDPGEAMRGEFLGFGGVDVALVAA